MATKILCYTGKVTTESGPKEAPVEGSKFPLLLKRVSDFLLRKGRGGPPIRGKGELARKRP